MIDTKSRERIVVHGEQSGGSYVMVPLDQLPAVTAVLEKRLVQHWVDADAISLDGKPAVIFVNLGRSADPASIQQILDDQN